MDELFFIAKRWIPVSLLTCVLFVSISEAQAPVKDRLPGSIGNTSIVALHGNVHPLAQFEFDRGPIDDAFVLHSMTMVFKPSDAQQADLDALLEQQQNPASSNYQHWLTPEEFADRFGLSTADMNTVVAWLRQQGFQVEDESRSRRFVVFSGTARGVESVFHTQIHQYVVNGETRYANATEPSVPADLALVVLGFQGLNNFRLKSHIITRQVSPDLQPNFTSGITGHHFLAPADFATIYDINPLYSAGINGIGQKIAIMGQTDISLADISAFRAASALPAKTPTVVLAAGSMDPGTSGDLTEADLDIEWSGAIALNAQIIYVNSTDAFFSMQYAVDENIAPIISVSYGACEADLQSEISALAMIGQQANSQGQTIVAAAGDAGATDCDGKGSLSATHGLAVDLPGAMPYVTSAGGTEFNDGQQGGASLGSGSQLFGSFFNLPALAYWSATNNSSNESALSYIPEMVWNDTPEGRTPGQSGEGIASGGGGKSTQFTKPVWQVARGVPNDGVRDVPDIAFSASADIDPYLICTGGSCVNGFRNTNNTLMVVGGTSVSAPSFAGVAALLNQAMQKNQGNVNPNLYRAALAAPAVFHDIVISGNAQPCESGSVDCPAGGYEGYAAGTGYDLASGLGSIDVNNLVNAWYALAAPVPASKNPL